MFGKCCCKCHCPYCLEYEKRREAWIAENASYKKQTLKLGDTVNKQDGVYLVYYRKVICIYPDVVDKVIQLQFTKCWETKWWVKIFGRLDTDWAPWVFLYATIFVEDNKIVFLKKERHYI